MLKKEYHVLATGSVDEIIQLLTSQAHPLTKQESQKVLRILVGRSRFDYRLPSVLQACGCDMNVSLDSTQIRCGDYLAYYGRLSPRLIFEMNKAGYDFTKTNCHGRHAGYYLHAYSTISDQVVGALKQVGVDFNHLDSNGQTVVDRYCEDASQHGYDLTLHRFCGLCNTQRDIETLCSNDQYHIGSFLTQVIDSIPARCDSTIGIEEIYRDNSCKYRLAQGMRHYLKEEQSKPVIPEEKIQQAEQQRQRVMAWAHGDTAIVEMQVHERQNENA